MKRLCLLICVATACRGNDTPVEVSPVKAINVTLSPQQIVVGATAQASAVLVDQAGNAIVGRKPQWISLTPAVVSIDSEGVITGLQAGGAAVRARAGSVTTDAPMVVTNPVVSGIVLSRDTATVLIPNGAVQLIATVRDETGNIIANPPITWQSSAPLIATVNTLGLVTGVATGTTTIRASIDGQSAQSLITVKPMPVAGAPVVIAINPPVLQPGNVFTLVGNNFGATAAANAVVVDGVPVTINAATANAISVTLPAAAFPCEPTHTVFVQVTANGLVGGGTAPLKVANARTLRPGQSVVVSSPSDVRCNELPQTGGRYVLSVYNAYRGQVRPGTIGGVPVVVRGAPGIPAAASASIGPRASAASAASGASGRASVVSPGAAPATFPPAWNGGLPLIGNSAFEAASRLRRAREAQQTHERILASNLDYLRERAPAIRARFARPRRPLASSAQIATVGTVTQLKVPNLDAPNFCASSFVVGVRTVFVGAHTIIVEDTSSRFEGRATLQGRMNSSLVLLGQEFETVMWPILTSNFGNPLVLDAQLSGTGKVVMLFSPRVNALQQGRVQGFSVTCDFQAVAQAPSSNVGEYFYAAVPTSLAAGYASPESRDSWMRTIRATVIHEVKHVVQFGERLSRSLPLEEISWEEGMARNVEELYARTFYNNRPARQDVGYAASVGCDLRFAQAAPPECANRPLLMLRHFDALYQYLSTPEPFSPLGRVFGTDVSFYASAWSLERWANDHFATSESQFLKDFTLSPVTGIQNLEARTGRPWEEMMGEWSLALYLDNEPGYVSENARLRFPSWNLRDIWLGLCSDLGPCVNPATMPQLYPRANPFQARALQFGTFTVSSAPISGGSFTIFELTGTQAGSQLIEIRSASGSDPAPTIRLAIARVQ
ncbi:MAG TPA: Ig-like domain-containing protein [Gemmatimonadaceae bacterium]|nr:Ig-like domain-containing protein [Gemmatimonadaceae bacterium]